MTVAVGAWREQTSRAGRAGAIAVMLAVGAVLVYACRPATTGGDGNRIAAFWLGVLLVGVGAVSAATVGTGSVEVDPVRRVIVTERRSLLGVKVRIVAFDEIERVSVQTLAGHRGMPAYHVSVRLVGGGRVPLFVGFFAGQFSRAAMAARCHRIESALAAGR